MTSLSQLRAARVDRDIARREFDALRSQVETDLDNKGIGARMADRATGTATDIFVEAIELADNHRGVIAGTIVALALWFFRNPIIAALRQMMGHEATDREDVHHD